MLESVFASPDYGRGRAESAGEGGEAQRAALDLEGATLAFEP